jgi:glycerophosphoryl diester phosphodiesterase
MSNPFLKGAPRPPRPLVVGHRGAMGLRPENTLESFELAFDLGSDLVELDVHLTRDGQAVVIHDDTLERTTDITARRPNAGHVHVSDLTLKELQELDAGRWFVEGLGRAPAAPHGASADERQAHLDAATLAHLASGKVHPPSLEEVLRLVVRRDRRVNVELKLQPRRYEGLVEVVVGLIRRLKVEERVVLSSFDHAALAHCKRLAPELPCAVLTVERLHLPGRYVAEVVGADGWNPGCIGEADALGFGSVAFATRGEAALDHAAIADARAHGLQVQAWTANDDVRLRGLVALGVDGIITDFPNRLVALRK